MNSLIKTILDKYQVRKSYKDKSRFIELLTEYFNNNNIKYDIEEYNDFFKTRNIVVGDINEADTVFTAHYDTCARMIFPNFITPKNLFIYAVYSIILAFFLILTALVVKFALLIFTKSDIIGNIGYFLTILLDLYLMMFGFKNKHTVNDNTSGVVTLLNIMDKLSSEEINKSAFVFFDNEEIGLVGAFKFKNKHKDIIDNKVIINFDCVSDGDNMLFVTKELTMHSDIYKKMQNIIERVKHKYNKGVLLENSKNTFYPSDQMVFKNAIGVAGLKKNKILGYYLDKIHTNKDIVFKKENIDLLTDIMVELKT